MNDNEETASNYTSEEDDEKEIKVEEIKIGKFTLKEFLDFRGAFKENWMWFLLIVAGVGAGFFLGSVLAHNDCVSFIETEVIPNCDAWQREYLVIDSGIDMPPGFPIFDTPNNESDSDNQKDNQGSNLDP